MNERKEWMEMIHLEVDFGWWDVERIRACCAASETTLKKLITVCNMMAVSLITSASQSTYDTIRFPLRVYHRREGHLLF